jgi:predicted Zn-ribbon and HTH transcriptional regulator
MLIEGVKIGINHLDYTESYYPGLNQYSIGYDSMAKHVTIGQTTPMKFGEDSFDEYMQELLENMRSGLRAGVNTKQHITKTLLNFSDRKFKDKDWWGNLTESEINELLKGVRDFYLPHTAMLDAGLSEAYVFGKFSKILTENMTLKQAKKKVEGLPLSKFDKARIDSIQKTAHIFWDKAISRETDSAAIGLLKYNRDVTTEILKNPDRKSWRSLTSDIYHGINKDKSIVLRDLDRITRTEIAHAQNYAILSSGKDSGFKYFIVRVRPTACPICKGMYLDETGKSKKFLIDDYLNQARDVNWGRKASDYEVTPPPAHPHCFCLVFNA